MVLKKRNVICRVFRSIYPLLGVLFILWIKPIPFQVSAYGEAFDSSIKVEVLGDMEAARKLITKEEEPRADIYSESDNEQDQQEVRNIEKL